MKKLSPKQEAFALAYCRLSNASEAYKEAYAPRKASSKTINEMASRLLNDHKISARIAEVMREAAEKTGLSVERTLKEIARLSYFDKRKLYKKDGSLKRPHEWDDDTAAAISHMGRGGPVPFDKNAALEKAMKYHGLYEKDNRQAAPTVVVMAGTDAKI